MYVDECNMVSRLIQVKMKNLSNEKKLDNKKK